MTEGPAGCSDSRPEDQVPSEAAPQAGHANEADTYQLYQRGLDLLGRGSAAAAAQLLARAAEAEPHSRSVLEALARAQFDTGQYRAAAGNFRRIVDASPSDDYAQFGLALAAAMRPNLRHYTDALRSVRATLRARSALAEGNGD